MFNFNWFQKPEYPERKEMPTIPSMPFVPKTPVRDHYRVGYDPEAGLTTLTVHAEMTSMTLSLPPEEVFRMIRMLSATLSDTDLEANMDDGDHNFDQD